MRYYKAKRVIRDFTRKINPTIKVKFNRKGLNASDMKRKVVYLDLQEIVTNPYHNLNMQYHFRNATGLVAYTLLHELGHIQTAHQVENLPQELANYGFYVEKLRQSDLTYKTIAKSYSKLKLERLANQWAYDYVCNHSSGVDKLKNDLLELGLT